VGGTVIGIDLRRDDGICGAPCFLIIVMPTEVGTQTMIACTMSRVGCIPAPAFAGMTGVEGLRRDALFRRSPRRCHYLLYYMLTIESKHDRGEF
jgi:hypothetical protein